MIIIFFFKSDLAFAFFRKSVQVSISLYCLYLLYLVYVINKLRFYFQHQAWFTFGSFRGLYIIYIYIFCMVTCLAEWSPELRWSRGPPRWRPSGRSRTERRSWGWCWKAQACRWSQRSGGPGSEPCRTWGRKETGGVSLELEHVHGKAVEKGNRFRNFIAVWVAICK